MSRKKKIVHVIVVLLLFANDLADFISDWLLFVDVKIAETGMVYGPPDPAAVWALLAFSIIGTGTFAFECANLWWDEFRNDPWLDPEYLSAIVIWIEDIPQVIISLTLVLCREEPVSVFQLSKAAVILISVVIRIIYTLIKYCRKEELKQHHHVKTRVVIVLGIIIEAICAGAIFFLTQTERDGTGDVSFRVPTTVVDETFNDQRYFANVSIFMNADLFDAGALDINKSDTVGNWLHVSSINNIRRSEDVSFRMNYEVGSGQTLKLAMLTNVSGAWTLLECYNISQSTANISSLTNSMCSQGSFTNLTSLFMTFHYVKPGTIFKKQIFGDILYRVKRQTPGGSCDHVDTSTAYHPPSPASQLTFHYYRTNKALDPWQTKHLLQDSAAGSPRFYRNDIPDLTDVSEVWKTGWRECPSEGYHAPNTDEGLPLECS